MFLQKDRLVQVLRRGRASFCTSNLGENEARGGSSNEVHCAGAPAHLGAQERPRRADTLAARPRRTLLVDTSASAWQWGPARAGRRNKPCRDPGQKPKGGRSVAQVVSNATRARRGAGPTGPRTRWI